MKFKFSKLVGFIALALASCAGFVSVIGMGQMFAGASTIVMTIMATLEITKLVSASLVHRYWSRLTKLLKGYLVAGVILLMVITSAGIYGFLSSAYQKTASKFGIEKGESSILKGKQEMYENEVISNKNIIDSKTKRISQLTDLRTNQENRIDSLIANKNWVNVRRTRDDIDKANTEIQKLTNDIDGLVLTNVSLSDSVNTYKISILKLSATSEVAGELGPLIYLSELTGKPMDSVINWVILILIFVFDPMAVILVITSKSVSDFEEEDKEKGELNNIKFVEPRLDGPTPLKEGEYIDPNFKSITSDVLTEEDKEVVLRRLSKRDNIVNRINNEHQDEEEEINIPEPNIIIVNDETPNPTAYSRRHGRMVEQPKPTVINLPEEPVKDSVIETKEAIEESLNTVINNVIVETPKLAEVKAPEIKRRDIKEVKELDRGFSVKVPKNDSKTNIQRIDNK